ncbi:MAG: XdhC family protein [Cyclobacteriaceae bacterium]|nr:XdhC family protein [Cyclobacteriaceae bacterium]
MKDILPQIKTLMEGKEKFALATVVKTWRSAPRPVGSSLVVRADGAMIGSVSGGCVEKSVIQKSIRLLASDTGELVKYGVADEEAWEVGLSCGGAITVFVQPFFGTLDAEGEHLWKELEKAVSDNVGVVLISKLHGSPAHSLWFADGSVKGAFLSPAIAEEARRAYDAQASQLIGGEGEDFFAQVFAPKNRMVLIGSAHITAELIGLAHMYDFETIVIDPRDTFAKKTTYKVKPDSLYVNWPQEVMSSMKLDKSTYAVILSHDPKIDDEALKILLKSDVKYIGALGSGRTHAKRVARLQNYGFSEAQIQCIHAPIGVDIRAQLPNEIALSVMAEVIKAKNS